jgi:hypothetical protein
MTFATDLFCRAVEIYKKGSIKLLAHAAQVLVDLLGQFFSAGLQCV